MVNEILSLAEKHQSVDVISLGFDLRNTNIITKSKVVWNDGKPYLLNGGIRIKLFNEDFSELYLDTKANRKFLSLIK